MLFVSVIKTFLFFMLFFSIIRTFLLVRFLSLWLLCSSREHLSSWTPKQLWGCLWWGGWSLCRGELCRKLFSCKCIGFQLHGQVEFLGNYSKIKCFKFSLNSRGCASKADFQAVLTKWNYSVITLETNYTFQWIEIYPVDSAINPLNNWGEYFNFILVQT